MRKFLHTITNFGIQPDTPFALRNKLTVYNNSVVVVLLISIFYLLVSIFTGFLLATIATVFSVFACITSLILVRNGNYLFAFHLTMWYAFLFLSSFTFLFGNSNNSYFYFLFLPVASNILFDDRKCNLLYMCVSIVFLMANILYVDHFTSYYFLKANMKFIGYPNIVFAAILIFTIVRLFKKENLRYAEKIEDQNKILELKNHEITDSINYAKKIQNALLPDEVEFRTFFKDSFVWLKPKDIVSGDFSWVTRNGEKIFYATADCTGHGVPGGFMTMLGISFLNEIVDEQNIFEPAEILNQLRERIIHSLKQTATVGESKDGMDITFCVFDEKTKILKYAAANNSLFVLSKGNFKEYKPDKQPVGFHHEINPFTQHEIQLQTGDFVYTFTDGFPDQFGGPRGKKFKYRQLTEKLVAISEKEMSQQKNILEKTFDDWKGNLEQVDDVLVIGIRT